MRLSAELRELGASAGASENTVHDLLCRVDSPMRAWG